MLESAHGKKMSIEKYNDVASSDTTTDEIVVNKEEGLFMNIFCNYPKNDYLSAPIFLDLSKLKKAISNLGKVKLGDNNEYDLLDHIKKCKNNDEKFHLTKIADIYNDYMLFFHVTENPNKFLWEVLNTRKQKSFILAGSIDDTHLNDVSDPLNKFYMGLDRVAQFLNFCVMLRGLPKQLEENSKVVAEPESLQFEARVLEELLNQYKEEGDKVKEDIDEKQLDKYKEKLKNLRAKYNNYCRAMINKDGGAYDQCISFAKWISQEGNFKEGFVRVYDNGFPIGIYNDDTDKVIDNNDVDDKKNIKYGYHKGGGITDKTEKAKLLRLDAVLQAEKAINQFINSKAVDSQTLNWFQKLWNHIVNGTFIANNWGWFFKERNVTLKSNKFIPRLDEFENKTQKSGEEIE